MANSAFGEHLRREREVRGISVDEVSAATRISVRFLEAIEAGRWDQLPGGVFNRGFIRAVARFLGLDEENLIAEYCLETKNGPNVSVVDKTPQSSRRAIWWIGGAMVLCALLVGIFFIYRYASHFHGARLFGHSAQTANPTGNATPGQPVAAPAQTPASTPDMTTATATVLPPLSAPDPSAPLTTQPVPGSSSTSGVATESNSHPAGSTTLPAGSLASSAPSSSDSPADAAGALELKVQAREAAHVRVLADGSSQFDGVLTSGNWRRFRASDRFEISTDNPAGLLVQLNGKIVPLANSGGATASITLTKEDAGPGGEN
jgi:cytoskeleton protein RodZ